MIWLYCFTVSVILPPFKGFYTYDETFITDSGVFIWYGKTPRILDWPASPSVLTYTVLFGVSVLFTLCRHAGSIHGVIDLFRLMDLTAFDYLADREPYILLGRAIQWVVVALTTFFTLRFIFRQTHPLLTPHSRPLIGLLIVSSHVIWNNGAVLRPEAVSGGIFLYVLCRLLFSEMLSRKQVTALSFLFGIVIAERLIFLFLSPLFFLGIYLLAAAPRLRETLRSLGIFLLAFAVGCPFILTDPLIIAKAFIGGIFAKVNDNPMASFFNRDFIFTYLENPVHYVFLFLCAAGMWELLRTRKPLYFILAGNWLFFLFLVLRSSKIYDPHVLPAAILCMPVAGLGLGLIAGKHDKKRSFVAWGAALVVVISGLATVADHHTWVRRDQNLHDAYQWLETLPDNSRLLVNIDLGLYLHKNEACLRRELEANSDPQNQLQKLNFLLGMNPTQESTVSETNLPLAAAAFAFEDEDLFDIQYRLLLRYGDKAAFKRFDYDIYLDNAVLVYHAIPFSDAVKRFRSARYDYMVTEEILDGLQPLQEFSAHPGAVFRVYKPPVNDLNDQQE